MRRPDFGWITQKTRAPPIRIQRTTTTPPPPRLTNLRLALAMEAAPLVEVAVKAAAVVAGLVDEAAWEEAADEVATGPGNDVESMGGEEEFAGVFLVLVAVLVRAAGVEVTEQ